MCIGTRSKPDTIPPWSLKKKIDIEEEIKMEEI
jgi:hypothetical protein